ncbi:penicillin acylase family protein, partial [Candidatus Neomarinimicrobiota bacterium]
MKNLLKWTGLFILLLILFVILSPNLLFRVPEPARSGTMSLPGLIDPVTALYDEYAVPHIYADNEHDLFYAAGYIMASERLFQIDLTNRAVQGRLAEMNSELVSTDKYLRTLGFHHIGKQMAAIMNPDIKELIQWGCDGINAYIDSHLGKLPLEFKLIGHEPLYWDPSIVCGFDRLMATNLYAGWGPELAITRLLKIFGEEETQDLFPGRPTGFIPPSITSLESLLAQLNPVLESLGGIVGGGMGLQASNNWVISREKTDSEGPLLANDMHLGYSQPPVWYEMHLVGGRFNVQGLCFPGALIVIAGHNEHIAWGFTNLGVDDADLYLEQVNARDSTTYLYKGAWVPFRVREEVIRVKAGTPVAFMIRETVHGVIINDLVDITQSSDQLIAMRWIGQDITDDITPFVKLNLAQDWDDFSAAAREFSTPSQNVVYADQEGNIGWRPFARIPIRKGAEYLTVLPGASGEYDWQGYVPFEEMPF